MLSEDVRYAWRSLRARPAFSLSVAVLMAGAIGANTTIFSLVQSILLNPLPFRDPSGLVLVTGTRVGSEREPFSIADFLDVRQRTRAFDALVPAFQWSANLTGGNAERLQGMKTSSAFFEMLGIAPVLGRTLQEDDEQRGGRRVVVITNQLWRRRFGATPTVVGMEMVLNGDRHTIVGVLPPRFVAPIRDAEVIAPFVIDDDPRRAARDSRFLRVLGRLRRSVSIDQAQAEVAAVVGELRRAYPNTNGTLAGARVVEWHRSIVANARPALVLLQAVAGVVLLVACANLANLLLAAAARREREFAVRVALGAARRRIAQQILIEGALLASAGALSGLLVSHLARHSILALAPADWTIAASESSLDWRMLGFTGAVTAFATLTFGLMPAWRLAAANPATSLCGAGHVDGVALRGNVRGALVAIEVALATTLAMTTVLLAASLTRLHSVDPGFSSDHLLTVRLSLPRNHYPHGPDMQRFVDLLYSRLRALPGVTDAAAVNVVPLNNYIATADVWAADRPMPAPDRLQEAHYRMTSAAYLSTFGVPLIAGRSFDEHDTSTSAPVVLVSRRLADQLWPGGDAVGRDLGMTDSPTSRRARVVGVVGNVRHFGLEADPTADVYVPISQVPEFTTQWLANNMYWGVRTTVDPLALAEPFRRELRRIDADVPASAIKSMDDVLSDALAPRRLNLWLVELFSLAALVLAAVGVYAVTACSVASRTRELAIRAALGAGAARNVYAVVQDVVRAIAIGLIVGAVITGLAMPVLRTLLFGVETVTGARFAAVNAGMLLVGISAAVAGAAQVRFIDPIVALKEGR